MAQYKFLCSTCGFKKARLSLDPFDCPKCKSPMKRNASGPTNQVYEQLDNGLMPRKVERLADAERLFKDRAKNDPNGQGNT